MKLEKEKLSKFVQTQAEYPLLKCLQGHQLVA